jgi:hypothetical protein
VWNNVLPAPIVRSHCDSVALGAPHGEVSQDWPCDDGGYGVVYTPVGSVW